MCKGIGSYHRHLGCVRALNPATGAVWSPPRHTPPPLSAVVPALAMELPPTVPVPPELVENCCALQRVELYFAACCWKASNKLRLQHRVIVVTRDRIFHCERCALHCGWSGSSSGDRNLRTDPSSVLGSGNLAPSCPPSSISVLRRGGRSLRTELVITVLRPGGRKR
eukprot:gene3366-biopygen3489